MKILVINCGSSSLKYQVFDMDREEVLAKGLAERIGIKDSRLKHEVSSGQKVVIEQDLNDHIEAIQLVLKTLTDSKHGVLKDISEINAVGHRVAHGGPNFSSSVVITEDVKKEIRELFELAPLHNPANLQGIEAMEKLLPGVKQVAVFDTAVHQTMPPCAYLDGIP